jgi:hypothetical protein
VAAATPEHDTIYATESLDSASTAFREGDDPITLAQALVVDNEIVCVAYWMKSRLDWGSAVYPDLQDLLVPIAATPRSDRRPRGPPIQ